jgi:two-component system chemotaxis response regulator CheY
MSKILTEAGHTVIQAENGLDALEKYRAKTPDAVLMDITMPEMDGLTALKEIRAIDPAARVAMVTALGQQQIVLEAVKSGAKDFLVKPCEGERVLATVTKLCA